MGGPRRAEPGAAQGGGQSQEVDPWDTWRWRVKARAAGVRKEEYSETTFTEILIAIEANKENQAMAAMPMIRYHLSKVTDDALDEMNSNAKSPHPMRKVLEEEMIGRYAPAYWFAGAEPKAPPLEGVEPDVAAGVLEAFRAGKLPPVLGASVAKLRRRLEATANAAG